MRARVYRSRWHTLLLRSPILLLHRSRYVRLLTQLRLLQQRSPRQLKPQWQQHTRIVSEWYPQELRLPLLRCFRAVLK